MLYLYSYYFIITYPGFCKNFAKRANDEATSAECPVPLRADLVTSGNINAVLISPGDHGMRPHVGLFIGCRKGDYHEFGTIECYASKGLRKVGIIADDYTHLPVFDLKHRVLGAKPEVYLLETTHCRWVGLAIFAQDSSLRLYHHGRVIIDARGLFFVDSGNYKQVMCLGLVLYLRNGISIVTLCPIKVTIIPILEEV